MAQPPCRCRPQPDRPGHHAKADLPAPAPLRSRPHRRPAHQRRLQPRRAPDHVPSPVRARPHADRRLEPPRQVRRLSCLSAPGSDRRCAPTATRPPHLERQGAQRRARVRPARWLPRAGGTAQGSVDSCDPDRVPVDAFRLHPSSGLEASGPGANSFSATTDRHRPAHKDLGARQGARVSHSRARPLEVPPTVRAWETWPVIARSSTSTNCSEPSPPTGPVIPSSSSGKTTPTGCGAPTSWARSSTTPAGTALDRRGCDPQSEDRARAPGVLPDPRPTSR